MRWIWNDAVVGLTSRWRRARATPEREAARLEEIRLSMLDMLGEAGARQFPEVIRRIRQAADAEALWFLRSDLMTSLAALHGEHIARARMVSLSVLFDGMLPRGMMSRPVSLRG
jgi:hypothetical protein